MLFDMVLAQSLRAVEAPGHGFPRWLYWAHSIFSLLCMFLLLYGAYRLFDYVFRDIAKRIRSLRKKKDTSGLASLALLCVASLGACTQQKDMDAQAVRTAHRAAPQKDLNLTMAGLPPVNPVQRQIGIVAISHNVSLTAGIHFIITYDRGKIEDVKASVFGFTPGINLSVNSFKQARYYHSTNTYVVEIKCDQGIGLAAKNAYTLNVYNYEVKYRIFFSPDKPSATIYAKLLAANSPSVQNSGMVGGLFLEGRVAAVS